MFLQQGHETHLETHLAMRGMSSCSNRSAVMLAALTVPARVCGLHQLQQETVTPSTLVLWVACELANAASLLQALGGAEGPDHATHVPIASMRAYYACLKYAI